MLEHRPLRLALLGAGSVGCQVARLLLEHADELAERVGARLELVGIAVRNPSASRDCDLPGELITTAAESLIMRADIVVELIGGVEPARSLILTALESGADVVTANKAVLASHGPELFSRAEGVGAQLLYEAAVGGAIPVLRPLKDSLAGDRVQRIIGIVNGTSNFILDRMERFGLSLDEALAQATELGYAEADPTADIEGYDAAAKATIMASLAFHTWISPDSVHREGITKITRETMAAAAQAGQVVKHVAMCERITNPHTGKQGINVRVYPALINKNHPLAAVHDNNNAVFVEAEAAGNLMFYGAGAGGLPTASAVLGDVVTAARRYVVGGPGVAESCFANLDILPIDFVNTRYQVILYVSDAVGALTQITQIFAAHQISIDTVWQSSHLETEPSELAGEGGRELGGGITKLIIGTQLASESALTTTVRNLKNSSAVAEVVSVLRIFA